VPADHPQERELIEFCSQRLANFKVPRVVEFRDEIPRSPLGKVLRKYLV
jgi:long-chain acyl-CoA synthetase